MKAYWSANKESWCVDIPARQSPTGKRQRRFFQSRDLAREFCSSFQEEREEFGKDAITIEDRRWLGYWKQRVGPLSLMPDVVRFWKVAGEGLQPITVDDAVSQYCTLAEGEYSNRRSRADVTERLQRFAGYFTGRLLHEIDSTNLEKFLLEQSQGWNRWAFHKRLKVFYRLALRRKWVPRDLMLDIPAPKTPTPEKHIYTVKQFQSLLWQAEQNFPALLPAVVLQGFCFLRNAELVGVYREEKVLQWEHVLFDENLIHVPPGVSKGTRRTSGDERYIPISSTAARWLEPYRNATGPCVPYKVNRYRQLWRQLTDSAWVKRYDNALRHSCISYSIAANPTHGLSLTAEWAGNSEATIRKHYRRLLKPAEGTAWFGVTRWAEEMEALQSRIKALQGPEPPEEYMTSETEDADDEFDR